MEIKAILLSGMTSNSLFIRKFLSCLIEGKIMFQIKTAASKGQLFCILLYIKSPYGSSVYHYL